MSHEERWAVVKASLVEQAMRKKLDKGQIFRDEEKVARLVDGDIEAQAARRPHWKQEQIDKHFGGTRRPTSKPSCPHCDLVFNADDQEAARGDDGLLYCRQSCADRDLRRPHRIALLRSPHRSRGANRRHGSADRGVHARMERPRRRRLHQAQRLDDHHPPMSDCPSKTQKARTTAGPPVGSVDEGSSG
jgi:hypothetical protein